MGERRGAVEGVVVSFWRDRPTLVTGATGLVGAWLVRRLVSLGAHVVCVVRDWVPQSELVRTNLLEKVTVVRGDVRDQAMLERVLGEHEIDTVIHLAAQTIVGIANRNPVSTFESNIAGTWSLLEACRRSPAVKQIVMASSDKAYGDHEKLPYDEDAPLMGRHPYDVSKSCADLIAQSYAATYGMRVGITRCGNFYGGGDLNWNRIFPGTIRSIVRGERPVIRSRRRVRPRLLLRRGRRRRLHPAGREARYPAGARGARLQLLERDSALGRGSRPEDPRRDGGAARDRDPERGDERDPAPVLDRGQGARRMLGWAPTFDLDEGLARTIAWYREFLMRPGGTPAST